MKKFITWKVILVAILLLSVGLFGAVLFKDRNPDPNITKATWERWWDCWGYGQSVERESDYSIIFDTCVTLRNNPDGTVTRVMANLDVGLGEGSEIQ